MADREIGYDTDAGAFFVGDELRIAVPRPGEVVAPVEAVAEVSVASFERALSLYEGIAEGGLSVFLSDVPRNEFDADRPLRKLWLSVAFGHLRVEVGRSLGEDRSAIDIDALLAPLLDRHAAELGGSWHDEQAGYWSEFYSLALEDTARTMGELADLALEAQALLDAISGAGKPTAATARDLVASGHVGALRGQPESSWIDAKVASVRASASQMRRPARQSTTISPRNRRPCTPSPAARMTAMISSTVGGSAG